MNLSLKGRYALICGGSKGIGLAAAVEMSKLGCNITLAARHAESLHQAIKILDRSQGQVHRFIAMDMSDPVGVKKRLSSVRPGFQIVLINSGGPKGGVMAEASLQDLQAGFDSLILSAQMVLQHSLPTMRKDKHGRIINIISIGLKEPIPGLGVSNTIRGAMGNWAKTLAAELGPDGITVNNVLPGYTLTDRMDTLMEQRANKRGISKEEIVQEYIEKIPLRRLANPAEVGKVVAFLATDAAGYVNGVNLPVDGGYLHCL